VQQYSLFCYKLSVNPVRPNQGPDPACHQHAHRQQHPFNYTSTMK